jgi:Ricin-type beta-trefoil lectin domain-like
MPISNVWGMVTARHSGKIMDIDIAGGSRDSGAVLQQWQILPDQPNQRFRFERLSNGLYLIRVQHTNKVLDVAGASRDSGAAVVQWDWHGGDNQQFAIEDAGDGFYRIRAKHSGKVLDVTGASRENGARVIQWDQTGANQLWRHRVPID